MTEKITERTFISVLEEFGMKQAPWKCCPQGFEKANYPCYAHPDKDWWAEVYNETDYTYVWIVGEGLPGNSRYPGGKTFFEPDELHAHLLSYEKKEKTNAD